MIDATGTYGNPNRLGDGGIDAVNERAFEDRIERFLPALRRASRAAWAGRTILLTGSGHSAQTAARAARRVRARRARHARRLGGAQRRSPTGAPSTATRCPSARR